MAFGIKISKEGYDVKTTADKNLIYTSESESHKVFQSGKVSSFPTTISHNLGYVPLVDTYMYDGTDVHKVSNVQRVDDTDLVISSAGTSVFYVIFYEGGDS